MTSTTRKANTTRPITLAILHFLEHIPFEKKTVMNSKINKQIQKLGKKVASIREAHKHTQKSTTHDDDALTQIQVAVDAVKASWREKASEKTKTKIETQDPFGALKSKIQERLEILAQFETGVVSTRPEWYQPPAIASSSKKKPPSSSSPGTKRKLSNETESEKMRLQKKIKQVQSRNQKNLEQLRQKLRNGSGAARSNAPSSSSSNKKVVWKDGLRSQVTRNRKMLEEVFVFTKDLPSSAGSEGEILVVE